MLVKESSSDMFSAFCCCFWLLLLFLCAFSGWAVMPLDLAARVELLLVHSVGCTASFVQEAGIAALEGPDDGVREMRDEYRRRRDIVVDGLNAIPGVYCRSPDGAFYAFADVSSFGKSCRDIADLLLMEGFVAVLPGTDFGEGGEGFIRISYGMFWSAPFLTFTIHFFALCARC